MPARCYRCPVRPTVPTTALVILVAGLGCAHRGGSGTTPASAPPSGLEPQAPLPKPEGAGLQGSPHVLLGIPLDTDPSDDLLIDRTFWVASYNPRRLVANWVAWSLSADDLGSIRRRDTFRADPGLPESFRRVGKNDYRNSGYDRGHLCPSADRTASVEANDSTFLMTNMHPQVPELNQVRWKQVEEKERSLAAGSERLQIIAGGIFPANPTTIGPGIAVPDASFKIIVVLEADQTAADVTATTKVCSFIMPNRPEVKNARWYDYLVSVDEIEKQTGYDFLRDVPDDIENVIEAKVPTAQACGA